MARAAFIRKTKIYFDYISHAQVLRDHPNFKCLAAIDPKADTLKEAVSWNIPVVVKREEGFLSMLRLLLRHIDTFGYIREPAQICKAVILEKPLSTSLVDSKNRNLCAEYNSIS